MAGLGQAALPAAAELDLFGKVIEQGREAGAVVPRQVVPQPGPALGLERPLLRGRRQIHTSNLRNRRN